MQVTRAAFQAKASLNEYAINPKSHTLVRPFHTRFSFPMVDTDYLSHVLLSNLFATSVVVDVPVGTNDLQHHKGPPVL